MKVGMKAPRVVGDGRCRNGTVCHWQTSWSVRRFYAIEIQPGKGGQMVCAAGTKAQLMAKEGDYAQVQMPSGEVPLFPPRMYGASPVSSANEQHQTSRSVALAANAAWVSARRFVVSCKCRRSPHGGGDGGRHGTGKAPRTALGSTDTWLPYSPPQINRQRHR